MNRNPPAALCLLATLLAAGPLPAADLADGLIGHWKLAGDTRDSSGGGQETKNHGVVFSGQGAARFDGRKAHLQVADAESLRLGTGDFTLALWVHTDEALDDVLGDLASKYDPEQRAGFNLSLTHRPGVTHSQANFRQVHFGIDDGREDQPQWIDHGRPGNAMFIQALAVHDGSLYAGTCAPGRDEAGHVYRLETDNWINCGAPDKANAICSLTVFGGKLYAGTGKYRLGGSSLAESENANLGGKVFRYEGGQRWQLCGQLPEVEAMGGLVVYRNELFASSLYKPAGFFRYRGGEQWDVLESPFGKRAESLTVFNGQLFASCYDEGHVFRFDGKTWVDCGQVGPAENTQTYAFAAYRGELYIATWRTGRVYKYRGDNDWLDCGRLGEELEVMGMAVHNGKLYAGTLPSADVYRYDGETTWTKVGTLDTTPDVKYRRAWTMAEYGGRLCVGTLPSGKVWSMSAGCNVTYDKELPPGWHHVAAIRSGQRLLLFLDGKEVASSSHRDLQALNIDNAAPLLIGAGANDFFYGSLRDVRVYRRALAEQEVAALAAGDWKPVRIGSGVSGHIHPAACVTKKGTVIVSYCQSEAKDLLISRSTDGGRTWSEPAESAVTEKVSMYPGALTTLSDGRVVHIWNVWYVNEKGEKSRYPQFSISSDDGVTWSEPVSLPKNPAEHSVLRHPLVELAPDKWLMTLSDKTIVYNPATGDVSSFGDGRSHGLEPIVRTIKGTLVSGLGLRSTDGGQKWDKIEPFPNISKDGWRYDLMTMENGWLLTAEVIGPGVGGDKWRFVVSRDDGKSWDFDNTLEFYNPGRPIGGRACPKTVQLDKDTIGTVFYDTDENQPGGSGVFFLLTPIAKLAK
jgi:hypothetical protein